MKALLNFWKNKPFQSIILLALIVRLVAAIFSRGYGMHDDHFLVIEASQSWVDHVDYNNWLPWNQADPKPTGNSFTYVGLHYLLFLGMKVIHIGSPQLKMFLIRLLHALFSMIIVIFGYKICHKLSGEKSARQAGILLALLWFMPFMSVRNLVEVACIPFLVLGTWYILQAENKKHLLWAFFFAGLISGISFSFRFQASIFLAGTGLALLIAKKWKEGFVYGAGVLISVFIFQGITDYIIWHKPFVELKEYIIYNIQNRYEYGSNNYMMYILLLAGIIVPPLGIYFFIGFFYSWKKYLLLFLPAFLFLAFHTYFPNKQERFIFTIIPFFIMLGVMGWNDFNEKSNFWRNHGGLLKASYTFFWIINLVLLCFVTTAYSKKARVESMIYLSKYPSIHQILLEESNSGRTFMLPNFYLGKWIHTWELQKTDESRTDSIFPASKFVDLIYSPDYFRKADKSTWPDFVLFIGKKNLEQRLMHCENVLGPLSPEKVIRPGFIDHVMYTLNPANRNETIFIYKTGKR